MQQSFHVCIIRGFRGRLGSTYQAAADALNRARNESHTTKPKSLRGQDLLVKIISAVYIDVTLISEPFKVSTDRRWLPDRTRSHFAQEVNWQVSEHYTHHKTLTYEIRTLTYNFKEDQNRKNAGSIRSLTCKITCLIRYKRYRKDLKNDIKQSKKDNLNKLCEGTDTKYMRKYVPGSDG